MLPHSPQKLVVGGFFAPHFGQIFKPVGRGSYCRICLVPAGLPHCRQRVCRLVISPEKTCVFSALLFDIGDHFLFWLLRPRCFLWVHLRCIDLLFIPVTFTNILVTSRTSTEVTFSFVLGDYEGSSCSLCHSGVIPSKSLSDSIGASFYSVASTASG